MPIGTKVASLYALITLEDGQFRRGVRNATTQMKGLGQEAKSAGKSFLEFSKKATFAVGVFSGVAKGANELRKIGATALQNQVALEKQTGSAREAARWMQAVSDAMGGTVTQGEAAAQALTLTRFGLVETSEEAKGFIRTLRIMTAVSPQIQDTNQFLSELQLTLANTSFKRLDQLGLSVTMVKDRMGELQAATAGLSSEQAFNQAVLQLLGEEANKFGDEVLEVGDDMDWLTSQFDKAKERAGIFLQEGLEPLAGGIRGLSEANQEVGPIRLTLEIIAQGTGIGDTGDLIQAATQESLFWGAWLGLPGYKETYDATVAWQEETEQAIADAQRAWIPSVGLENGPGYGQFNPFVFTGTAAGPQYVGNVDPMAMLAATSFGGLAREDFAMPGSFGGAQTQANIEYQRFVQSLPTGRGMADVGFGGFAGSLAMGDATDAAAARAEAEAMLDVYSRVQGVVQGGNDALQTTMFLVGRIGDEGRVINTQWDSLNEKFGVAPSNLGTDVYGRAAQALRDVDLEAGQAEEALLALGLATGTTTVENELFNERLDVLAEKLAEGELSAQGYAEEVFKLGQADFSWVDAATAGMSFDEIQEFLEKWSEMDLEDGTIVDTVQAANDEIGADIQASTEEWITPIGEFVAKGGDEFGSLRDEATARLFEISSQMDMLFGRTYTLTVSSQIGPSAQPGALGGAPPPGLATFHGGGYTGGNPSDEMLAMLRGDEYIFPGADVRAAQSGNGRRGGSVANVAIMLDGRVVLDAAIKEGERRNMAFVSS